jgi:hypothetical protein
MIGWMITRVVQPLFMILLIPKKYDLLKKGLFLFYFSVLTIVSLYKNIYNPVSFKSSIDKNNIEKNLLPYAYYSTGRSISGNITYSSPIKPWLFAEKLSGPSSINNGGIIFDFGPFKLELPEIIWSTQSSESSMEQVHQKRVNWSVVSKNFDFDPYLKPTGIY